MARGDGQGGCACASRRMRGGRAGAHLGVGRAGRADSDWSRSGPMLRAVWHGAWRCAPLRRREQSACKRACPVAGRECLALVPGSARLERMPSCSFIFTPRQVLGWGGKLIPQPVALPLRGFAWTGPLLGQDHMCRSEG